MTKTVVTRPVSACGVHDGEGGEVAAPAFDAHLYEQRNMVERCSNRLKRFRNLATRAMPIASPTTRPNSPSPPSRSGFDALQETH
jgi:transposase